MEKNAYTVETEEFDNMNFEPEEIMTTDEMPFDDLVVIEESKPSNESNGDYDKTQKLSDFMSWITKKMHNLPPHSGKTTAGCERVIAHLKMLDKEISKAISRDIDCDLDDQAVEKFRKEIRKMIKTLDKRHKEINEAYDADDNKFAAQKSEITKEAEHNIKESSTCGCAIKNAQEVFHCPKGCKKVFYTKDALQTHMIVEHGEQNNATANVCPDCNIQLWKAADDLFECISCEAVFEKSIVKEAGTPKVQLIMDPFQRAITGIIVNSVTSQGRNAEDVYAELKEQYKFSSRDELGLQQLLTDLGMPVPRNFMGMPHSNDIEFATNYNA